MNCIDVDKAAEQRIYPIEELLLILHPMERYLRILYLNFKRYNGHFSIRTQPLFVMGLLVLTPDALGNIIKLVIYIRSSSLTDAQQVCATFSLEILCYIRLLMIVMKYKKMENLANALDAIYPRTLCLQKRFKVPAVAASLEKRFRYLYYYVTLAIIFFIGIPICKYYKYYGDGPMRDDYHQHASWLPFGIKEQPKYYPYTVVYETNVTFWGICCLIAWDRYFVVCVSILGMQFDFLNAEIQRMNAEDSLDPEKAAEFNRHMKNCLQYQQLLNNLGDQLTDIFSISIFFSDMVCASSICLHLYLVVNTDDVMSFLMFLFPIFALVFILYDISKYGTQLTDKSNAINESLYNQNWYNGSHEYRKLLIMWLHYSQNPCIISALHIFEVGMVHFKKMAMLTYQMFAFIQSRKKM